MPRDERSVRANRDMDPGDVHRGDTLAWIMALAFVNDEHQNTVAG